MRMSMMSPKLPLGFVLASRTALAFAMLFLAACDSDTPGKTATPSRPKPAVVISEVRVDRNAFDPGKGQTATIKFKLDRTADTALSIYDGRDRLVYTRSAEDLAAGEHTFGWDGRDGKGAVVPSEAYTYTLTATNAKGTSIYDLTELTGGQSIQAKDVRWDPQTGRVHYYLDKPARVNLRLGLDSGPHLRTVVDWVPRRAGAHTEVWDGKDASGVLDLAAHPMLKPAVTAYALPDNTLFVGDAPDRVRFLPDTSTRPVRQASGTISKKRMANHMQQPLETRGDLEASLRPLGDFKQDAQGRWVVKGEVPFRVDVAVRDRQRAIQRRFEAVFYVDGVFTYENELGYLPMTWRWDSSRLNPGEHFVTLNIRGYEGNFGTATVKVLVLPETAGRALQADVPAKGK